MKKGFFILLIALILCFLSIINSAYALTLIPDSSANQLNEWRQKDSLAPWLLTHTKVSYSHRASGNFELSLSVLDTALNQAWRSPKSVSEKNFFASALVNRAYLNERKGSFVLAQQDYLDASQIYSDLNREDYNIARYVWHPLGNIYTRLGENEMASHFIKKSLDKYQEIEATWDLIQAYSDLGIVLINQKKYEQAIVIIDEGLKIDFDAPINKALLHNGKASALLQLKQFHKGLDATNSSLYFLNLKKGEYVNQPDNQNFVNEYLTGTHTLRGLLFSKLNLLNKAEKEFNQALSLCDSLQLKKHRKLSKIFLGIASNKLKENKSKEALDAYQKALIACLKHFNDTSITSNPNPNNFYAEVVIGEALLGKAQAATKHFHYTNNNDWLLLAKDCYQLYFLWEKKIRAEYYYESSKLLFTEELHQATESALEMLMLLQQKLPNKSWAKQAFQWIEQSKGVLLSESSTNLFLQIPKLKEDSTLLQLQLCKKQYRLLEKNKTILEEEKSAPQLQKLQGEILSLESDMAEKHPYYHEAKTKLNDTLDFKKIKNYLGLQNADLANYYLGRTKAFVVLISDSKFHFYQLDRAKINHLNGEFKQALLNQKQSAISYEQIAFRLYRALIPFDSISQHANWIVLPDAELNQLPFEALVYQIQKNQTDYKHLNYLIHHRQISYAPSAKYLLRSYNNAAVSSSFLGIAPDFRSSNLANLKHAEQEIEIGKNQFGGQVLNGKSIDKSILFEELPQYKIVHWVSHAGIDSSFLDGAWIALNPNNDDTSKVFPPELLDLQLSTPLLILNACETAVGKYKAGEGVYSLSRGFSNAGAQNIITNLWQANHEVNTQLISLFYTNLERGNSISEALSNAKRDYLNNENTDKLGAHPYYWAAPILIGNNRDLKLESNFYYILLLFLLPLILLILVGIKKYYSSN